MLLTDTDSLIYYIEAENVYEDFYKDKELFDFSNYPKDSKYYANNLVVGKMKDETRKTTMNLKKAKALIKILLMTK